MRYIEIRNRREALKETLKYSVIMLALAGVAGYAMGLFSGEDVEEIDRPAMEQITFEEHSVYTTKDKYFWSRSYIYIDGKWIEFRRVSPNGAKIYEWNGLEWVRISSHISRPATGWYSNQRWEAPPRYPKTTRATTTTGTTSY